MDNKLNLPDFDRKALEACFVELGEQPFRAQQVLKWIYHHGVTDCQLMTNLSKTLRSRLEKNTRINFPTIITGQKSKDGTRKWLIQIDDNNSVETVFIPEGDRGTLCVSSQVGCPLDCKFCSTAQQGFNRNLTTGEIIGQVWIANKALGYFGSEKRIITNIVFMGMGEPLLNYDNVLQSINLLTDDLGFGLARRRVTVSTSGIIPGIDRLQKDTDVSLAVSLHASDDELRNNLVPVNRTYPLKDLLAACKRFTDSRDNEPVTIEYVMLKDINDSEKDARNLVKRLQGIPAKVNLIPFNKFPGTHYKCSTMDKIDCFRDILSNAGVITITRKTRGDDIDAACGQLVGKVVARAKRYQNNQMGVM